MACSLFAVSHRSSLTLGLHALLCPGLHALLCRGEYIYLGLALSTIACLALSWTATCLALSWTATGCVCAGPLASKWEHFQTYCHFFDENTWDLKRKLTHWKKKEYTNIWKRQQKQIQVCFQSSKPSGPEWSCSLEMLFKELSLHGSLFITLPCAGCHDAG